MGGVAAIHPGMLDSVFGVIDLGAVVLDGHGGGAR